METVFPEIYIYICVYVCVSWNLYIRRVRYSLDFFFSSSIFVQKSIIRHQKNFTTHFSPSQLFNKFDPRLKFYLSDTRFQNREPIIPFFVDIFSSILRRKKIGIRLFYIYLFFRIYVEVSHFIS